MDVDYPDDWMFDSEEDGEDGGDGGDEAEDDE